MADENLGAVKVYAVGGMMSMARAVELPRDPAKRKELFDFQTRRHLEMNVPPQRDEGQKLMLRMRISYG